MRIVVLGCGTGIGKTRVSTAILRELGARGRAAVGMKPIESGLTLDPEGLAASDASALVAGGCSRDYDWLPLFHFAEPISPHLAARSTQTVIDVQLACDWVIRNEQRVATHMGLHSAIWSVVETAGGVFSPLSLTATNFDLALALDSAVWVLVAADALGVLHDISATLQAMSARGRLPDHVVLSGARPADASTGTNAAELAALGICHVSGVLARNDDRGVSALVDALLAC